MSRLIVKGIPKHYTDANIRELFSFAGELTDARVIRTRDGRSRQFGFVGFRTRQAAATACRAIDATYVGTARVSVEHARAVGDDQLPRPWSKYSEGSSRYRDRHGGFAKNVDAERGMRKLSQGKVSDEGDTADAQTGSSKKSSDPRLDEFVEVARGRRAVPVWADGGLAVKKKSILVPSRKTGAEGKMLERNHVTFQDSDDEDDALYENLPQNSTTSGVSEPDVEDDKGNKTALDQSVSDMDYLKSKMAGTERMTDQKSNSPDPSDADEQPDDKQGIRNEENNESEKPAKSNKDKQSCSSDDSGNTGSSESSNDAEDPKEKKGTDTSSNKVDGAAVSTPGKKKYLSDGVDAAETGRLLVRNLAFSATEEELESAFESFGTLADIHIVRDGKTGRSKGIGFVQYMIPENAVKALMEMDGSFLSGRILHVLPAKPKPTVKFDSVIVKSTKPGSSSYKTEREAARKEAARSGQDAVAQHSLHLSSDAVAEIAAQRHGVSKAELLGTEKGESGIAAVRLAMAEASLQQETRQYLLSQGVDLAKAVQVSKELNATTSTAKRKRMSRLAFLAKNLPAGTTRSALQKVFIRFGKINRLVVAPSGLLAVVEYSTASDAKRAYTGLAYTKFCDAPLYLEWLPSAALSEAKKSDIHGENSTVPEPAEALPESNNVDVSQAPMKREDADEQTSTVYVKNLNFDTRDEELKEHFFNALRKRRKVALSLRSATVAMKKGKEGKGSEKLSMGFGFLEFATANDATEAIKLAQSTTLDGHVLTLKMSNRAEEPRQATKRKRSDLKGKPNPKLIVRNVAFEATRKDIRRLFSVFGQLKVVRLPKKMDGSHRGFAFVEFVSKGEAKAAMEALTSSHLYGRHLIIEYAEEGDDQMRSIAELQEKTASYMSRKRVRRSDNSADAPIDDDNGEAEDMELDEELQDALYG